MIRSAGLYENELLEEFERIKYTEKMALCTAGVRSLKPKLYDATGKHHCLVSVDKKSGKLIGYISYDCKWYESVADNLFIVSFRKTRYEFALDLAKVIRCIFFKYNMRKIEFKVVSGNPVDRHYQSFVKRMGGVEAGRYKDSVRLPDGTYHDVIMYEVFNPRLTGKKVKI